MIARFGKKLNLNARNYGVERETVERWIAVAYTKGKFLTPVTVRVYCGRSRAASTIYASIWVQSPKRECSGRGSASGCGYHLSSTAIGEAIRDAGVELFGSPYATDNQKYDKPAYIDGVGEGAVRSAVEAITRALGYKKFTVIQL